MKRQFYLPTNPATAGRMNTNCFDGVKSLNSGTVVGDRPRIARIPLIAAHAPFRGGTSCPQRVGKDMRLCRLIVCAPAAVIQSSSSGEADPPWRTNLFIPSKIRCGFETLRSLGISSYEKKSAGRSYPPSALFSLTTRLSLKLLLRLEVSCNDRTIDSRHFDGVAMVSSLWCLPVLDELMASSVIP